MKAVGATHQYHVERINGREVEKPLPKRLHALVQTWLLRTFFQQNFAGLVILAELDVLVGNGDWLVPDIIIANEKARFHNDMLADPPLLAIDILSPRQGLGEMITKCEELHRIGTPLCWIVWPEKRAAWHYQAAHVPEQVETLRFGEFALPIAAIWEHLPIEQDA